MMVNEDVIKWEEFFQDKDIIIISPQYWGDIWVSKHWLADRLSTVARVLFIEPPVWVGGILRCKKGWRGNLYRALRPLRKIKHNLHVGTPRSFPFGGRGQISNDCLQFSRRLYFNDPIVISFVADYRISEKIKSSFKIYYVVDPVIPRLGHENDERVICQNSDLALAISDAYRDILSKYNSDTPIRVVPHGIAFEHARSIAESSNIDIPRELTSLKKPILGFVGSIHDSFVDVDRLEAISTAFPDSSIVMVGPYKNNPLGPDISKLGLRRIRELKNVYLLGPKPFLDVPSYVKYFDVCLVLINLKDYDDKFKTGRRTLFKWLIYLSMGKPVVSPWLKDAEPISNLVYMTETNSEYINNINLALTEDGYKQRERVEYARQFSFENILQIITNSIVDVKGGSCGQ